MFHTYSSKLNVSTHFKLHSAAHDVHSLITANDGLSVSLDVQIR